MTEPTKRENPEEIELLSPYERSKIRAMQKDGLNRKVVRSESRDASPPLTSSQNSLNPEPTFSQIIEEEWNKGSETNKNRLCGCRLLVETFAYNCMERLKEQQKRRDE